MKEERTLTFSKMPPGDASGRIYPERDPPMATWYQWDGQAKKEEVAEAIGKVLKRQVRLINATGSQGYYSAKIRYLDAKQ